MRAQISDVDWEASGGDVIILSCCCKIVLEMSKRNKKTIKRYGSMHPREPM